MTSALTTPGNVVVAARTYLYLAPTGTAFPPDVSTAPATPWLCVGNTTEDALKFITSPSFQDIKSGQSDFPIRRVQTDDGATVELALMEWSAANFQAAFGGGTITSIAGTGTPPGPTIYKFTPPLIGERSEQAAMLEVHDGTKLYRFCFPRVFQIEGVELDLKKTDSSQLPLKLGVLGGDGTPPWYALTNDPSFATT
jgi:hypothetical protein